MAQANLNHEYPEFILNRQAVITRRISENVRYVSFGYLLAAFAIFSSSSTFSTEIIDSSRGWLVAGAIFAVLAIILDYLQYVFGNFFVHDAKTRNRLNNGGFNDDSYWKKSQEACFKLKQFLGLLASLTLALVLWQAVWP